MINKVKFSLNQDNLIKLAKIKREIEFKLAYKAR